MYIYIYIYLGRERERERESYRYTYIVVCIYIHNKTNIYIYIYICICEITIDSFVVVIVTILSPQLPLRATRRGGSGLGERSGSGEIDPWKWIHSFEKRKADLEMSIGERGTLDMEN